ncbi:hypothetical protein RB5109 [Rhodopirellula baltica SH 1]|uniref:Uncharacterized protein n=1 Tax=Rhodopirellula baltica (strain DSM 10527 / NCIMB 13988 / SH1) TaxID=243090 RepID=Q7UGN6_RHOBA|nr:hypothetical protein RB5109 [Rhodopirellula baltica SH 1]
MFYSGALHILATRPKFGIIVSDKTIVKMRRVNCEVKIVQCKLQSASARPSHRIPPICNCQIAMSTLQFAVTPSCIPIKTHRPGRGRRGEFLCCRAV